MFSSGLKDTQSVLLKNALYKETIIVDIYSSFGDG